MKFENDAKVIFTLFNFGSQHYDSLLSEYSFANSLSLGEKEFHVEFQWSW